MDGGRPPSDRPQQSKKASKGRRRRRRRDRLPLSIALLLLCSMMVSFVYDILYHPTVSFTTHPHLWIMGSTILASLVLAGAILYQKRKEVPLQKKEHSTTGTKPP